MVCAVSLTSAMPVVLLPGSIFTHKGCHALSASRRSTILIVKGTSRWTRARPRASKTRARFSLHGIKGVPRLSNTNTAMVLLSKGALTGLVTEARRLLSPRQCCTAAYPCGPFRADPQRVCNRRFQGLELRKHSRVSLATSVQRSRAQRRRLVNLEPSGLLLQAPAFRPGSLTGQPPQV